MSRDKNKIRDLFLLAILPHVVFEGWSEAAIAAGTKDLEKRSDFESKICSSPHMDIVLAAIFLPIPSKFILLPPALTI